MGHSGVFKNTSRLIEHQASGLLITHESSNKRWVYLEEVHCLHIQTETNQYNYTVNFRILQPTSELPDQATSMQIAQPRRQNCC